MKKILILQMRPEDEACDSEFEAILRVGEIDRQQVDRVRVERLGMESNKMFDLNLDRYSAIIAGGSPFDVSCPEDQKSPVQINVEAFFKALFDQVTVRDFPFLGMCCGNGLLGDYFNTPISGKYAEPVSSVEITLSEARAEDELLKGLPKRFPVLVGHKEACDTVPEHAVLLASSETCPVQMFRVGKNIYATQFHPEADGDEFVVRIHTYKNYGYFRPDQAEELISRIKDADTPYAKEILRRFVLKYHEGQEQH